MVQNWLWLLLPACVLLGWLAREWSSHLKRQKRKMRSEDFLRGLRFLLNEESDKAMESFINLFEVEPDTPDARETHILLGNAYRQRGEVDKATRMHHNVLNNLKDSDEQRNRVSMELGRDYFQAGMFDRAEEIFRRIIELNDEDMQIEACRSLVHLYEAEKSWGKAVKPVNMLIKKGQEDYAKPLAHYYCEMAVAALEESQDEARSHLNEAMRASKTLPRLLILEGDLRFAEGATPAALALWTQSFVRNPDYVELLLPRIKKTFDAHDAAGFAKYIGSLKFEKLNLPYIYIYSRALVDVGQTDELNAWLMRLAEEHRLPKELADTALYGFLANKRFDYDEFTRVLGEVAGQRHGAINYRCSHCGFEVHEHYWHCAACFHWDTAVLYDEVSSNA